MSDALGIAGAAKIAAFHVMRRLPAEFVSGFGSAFVRWSVPRHRPAVLAGARANLRRLQPDAGDEDIERLAWAFLDNVGRLMAEFALMHRLMDEGRVAVGERFATFMDEVDGPAIVIGLHTGNWEIFPTAARPGVRMASLSLMPESAADRAIAAKVRNVLGCEVFPTTPVGLRAALRWLETGQGPRLLGIFGDEARQGQLMAPLFGRPPHVAGNLAVIARVARRTGAALFVYHVTRLGGCRFAIDGSTLPPLPDGLSLEEDVALLNELIEPIVRSNLGQWYFLDNPF